MKIVSNSTYSSEHLNKHPKNMVYFNPDNTVTLFYEDDQKVRDWVYEHGKGLKQRKVVINQENYDKILEKAKLGEEQKEKEKEDKRREEDEKIESLAEKVKPLIDSNGKNAGPAVETPVLSKEDADELSQIITSADRVNIKTLEKVLFTLIEKLSK